MRQISLFIKNKLIKSLLIIFLLFFFQSKIFSEIVQDTLIKTVYGLIPVQALEVGDKVISNDSDFDVEIKEIKTLDLLCVVVIETDQEIIFSGPNQLFFDPVLYEWVRAVDLTKKNKLLDFELNFHQCKKISFSMMPSAAYEISLDFPHMFFITESQILTHNNAGAALLNLARASVRVGANFFTRTPGMIKALKCAGVGVISWLGLRRNRSVSSEIAQQTKKVTEKARNADIKKAFKDAKKAWNATAGARKTAKKVWKSSGNGVKNPVIVGNVTVYSSGIAVGAGVAMAKNVGKAAVNSGKPAGNPVINKARGILRFSGNIASKLSNLVSKLASAGKKKAVSGGKVALRAGSNTSIFCYKMAKNGVLATTYFAKKGAKASYILTKKTVAFGVAATVFGGKKAYDGAKWAISKLGLVSRSTNADLRKNNNIKKPVGQLKGDSNVSVQAGSPAPAPNNNGGEKDPKKDKTSENDKNKLIKNRGPVKPLGRGSTGRTQPKNLYEQLAMKEVMSNPFSGRILDDVKMTDKRWHFSDGWVKMQQRIKTFNEKREEIFINIHYVWNKITNQFDDFKFKDK